VGHTSRSSGLLCMLANLARVSQSGQKTGGVATTGGARGTIAECNITLLSKDGQS
jgi:hypothetical protein